MSKRDVSQYKIKDAVEQVVKPDLNLHVAPGVYLRDTILPSWGLNVSETARRINMDRATLHIVLSGKKPITRDLAYKLGALMRDEVADFLIAYQHAYDLQTERGKREAFKGTIERLPEPVGD
jgi:addiction module HigA family antidote